MQTLPSFVYLIPAILLFGLGGVPAVIATFIFSTPPSVRLTNLGIRQVPEDVVEAALAFGATQKQLLLKVQLPLAIPTIMAGINQTIMLALSMAVIASMIGAPGLGSIVLSGISSVNVGKGLVGGLGIVVLAIILDRITQGLGQKN
jgi:glycine betaine/proline transport system permease protein